MAPLGDRFSLAGLVCAAEKPGTAGLCTPKPCNHSCYATCAQTDVPTERPPVANQVGMNDDALSPAQGCDRQARHRGCLAMSVTSSVRVPDAEGFGSAGKERACTEQAPSGQQCALWCSCDLVGAVRARALSAWRPAEQAWKGLSGGWMAVCSWLGSCSPCWAPGEELGRLHARGSKCGSVCACSEVYTVCQRAGTLLARTENDVTTCRTGQCATSTTQEGESTTKVTPKPSISPPSAPQPDYRPQQLPPPRLHRVRDAQTLAAHVGHRL